MKARNAVFVPVFVVVLTIASFLCRAHALESAGVGSASILSSEDIEEARAEALEAAKEDALLRGIGLYVNDEILAREKQSLLKAFRSKRDEVVSRYKVVSDNRGEDGSYRVRIQAVINEDALKDVLMKTLYTDRVIVVTSEKNLGHPMKRHILEHELNRRVKGKGYEVVDYRTVRNETVSGLVAAIRQGDTEAVKKMGVYYLTDLVIVGFVESRPGERTKEIRSSHATGQVKIHKLGSKKEVLSLTKHDSKGFGSGFEKAGIDAVDKVSGVMAREAMAGVRNKPINKVKIRIRELADGASLRKAKSLIENIPYVKDVRVDACHDKCEEAVLRVQSTQDIYYIADAVDGLRKFAVEKIEGTVLFLEAGRL